MAAHRTWAVEASYEGSTWEALRFFSSRRAADSAVRRQRKMWPAGAGVKVRVVEYVPRKGASDGLVRKVK